MKKETPKRINISLTPSVIEKLDKMAIGLGTTRSGVITYLTQTFDSFGKNKTLVGLMDKILKDIIKP